MLFQGVRWAGQGGGTLQNVREMPREVLRTPPSLARAQLPLPIVRWCSVAAATKSGKPSWRSTPRGLRVGAALSCTTGEGTVLR